MGTVKQYTMREVNNIVGMWRDGASIKDISAQSGRSYNSIRGILYRQRSILGEDAVPYAADRGWSVEQLISLANLWEAGYTVCKIAQTIGKKPKDVYARVCNVRRKSGDGSKFHKRRNIS